MGNRLIRQHGACAGQGATVLLFNVPAGAGVAAQPLPTTIGTDVAHSRPPRLIDGKPAAPDGKVISSADLGCCEVLPAAAAAP